MAKKEISGYVKLQIKGGQANPAPPVGPALGQRGINIMEFCKAFNDKTKSFAGKPVPVIITVYKDKKFDFVIKSPPASHFIKEAMKLKSGSKEPGRNIIGSISKQQLKDMLESGNQWMYIRGLEPSKTSPGDIELDTVDTGKDYGEIAGGLTGPRNYPGEGVPRDSPRGPYTPLKNYGTDKNPKFMPSGPSQNPWRLA